MNQQTIVPAEPTLFAEHAVVCLKEDAVFDGMTVPAGSTGVVVSVHPEHSGYSVEFTSGNQSLVLDLLHDHVVLDAAWPAKMTFCTTGARPVGIRLVRKGERYEDVSGMHQYKQTDPLIEFYAEADPTQLLSRYRWNTVENFESVFHTIIPRRLGGSSVAIHAEYPGEQGGAPIDLEALVETIDKCRELLGPSDPELPFPRTGAAVLGHTETLLYPAVKRN